MKDISTYLRHHKTQLIPVGLVVLLAVLSIAINGLVSQRTELRSRAAADNGQLTLSTTATNVGPGQTFDASVNLVNNGQVVVGADIIVQFDTNKLTLQSITPGTSQVFKTFVPVNTSGVFDNTRVVSNSNAVGSGKVEFGIVTFDWVANALTAPTASNTTMSPVATLRFQVKTGATGTTQVSIKNDGTSATTDSNIVVVPAGGQPEDILQAAGYPNDNKTITITGTASPTPSPSASASPSPSPSASPSASAGTCTVRGCQNYNGTSTITISDIQTIASKFCLSNCGSTYNIMYDLNCDGKVTVIDIQTQAGRFNTICQ